MKVRNEMQVPTRKRRLHKINTITVFDFVLWIIMALSIVAVLYPVLMIVAGSFSNNELLIRNKVGIIPKGFTLDNYKALFKMDIIWVSYWNTIKYTLTATFFGVLLTTLGAYPLSKRHFVGRRFWNKMLLFTMLFSGGLIPSYLVVSNLGWINTIWAISIPGAIGAWYVILARTFFESIPASMEESAKIDGANDLRILFNIYMPLSKPIIATLALYYAVGKWNDFFGPLIYFTRKELQPLSLLMRNWLTMDNASQSSMDQQVQQISQIARNYTAIITTSLPIICLYPFIQKYFAKGMMIGAIKG
jgi:ABC-type sugar transport system, permease component